MLLEVSREAKLPILVGTVILVFLSIFTKCQASSPFEALNPAHLSKSQMDVTPYVKVVSGNLSRFLKGVKPLVLYDVDRGVVMETMKGKLASSQYDFGYSEQFCIPVVISVFFSSCDSVVGDSLEFNQPNRGFLRV